MLADIFACLIAAWAAFSIRLGVTQVDFDDYVVISAYSLGCWTLASLIVRPYRSTVRYTGRHTIILVGRATIVMVALLAFVILLTQPAGVPRTLSILVPVLFFCFIATLRVVLSSLIQPYLEGRDSTSAPKRVIVYGAGSAMQQIAVAVGREPGLRLVGIIDHSGKEVGGLLEGVPIWHESDLEEVLAGANIDELFLANAEKGQRAKRRELLDRLRASGMRPHVRVLPSIADVAYDKVSVSDLRPIEIGDLLGRDPVEPVPELIGRNIMARRVLVTGAGGSIGSELCRQILHQSPAQLIIADQSEYALYAIDHELRDMARESGIKAEIVSELVDVANEHEVERLFSERQPQTIYHAAAYKHVPLVEANVAAGIRNNVTSTLYCALAAERHGTDRFILVSTDKAVRPTNVMGASKRVCEQIIQARAAVQDRTCFSAVRFGNVLGSSGSVVPRFREQIQHGGPVTITHRDVTRFFMTIPEAAQLVIQAGAMAEGGEIFLLDMGEPVRIADLARSLIELSGLEVRDELNPDGDIEIVEVGLRPGEKLYEELLINDAPLPTRHPRIVNAHEQRPEWRDIEQAIATLVPLIENNAHQDLVDWLKEQVEEFNHDRDRTEDDIAPPAMRNRARTR
ncbi:nucleoside-diphosphate sugar epimerase/dehydratase [Sphingomicrobium lutaoense]|nr:nucleoside-diphosphate sugar epimerase/dehydratase [Sphingomicrobium lutaoense]